MTFKQRNSIILGLQTLLVSAAGLFINFQYYPDKFVAVQQEIAQCDQAVAMLPQREEYLSELNQRIEDNRVRMASWSKVVEQDISMADILDYLNKIQARFGSFKFSLNYVKTVTSNGYGYKIFTLNGEGDWQTIFALIWNLENGPKVFVIERLDLRGVEAMEEDDQPPYYTRFKMVVPFSMQVRAVYASSVALTDFPVNRPTEYLVQLPDGKNLFYPSIIRSLPPNDAGLVEVERAELKAIIPGKAMIADHLGNIHSLVEGDPVYLGYLSKIHLPTNTVEFLLNKGGIVEKLSLELRLGDEITKKVN